MARRPNRDNRLPDPRLVMVMRRIALVGAGLVLALPAARGHSQWLGAMPLWLLAMPLSSLWALHGFRLPRRLAGLLQSEASIDAGLRRRRKPQARRSRQYPAASRAFSASARPISISSRARQNS
ncbi:MAG: hypothetical protein ABIR05_02445 [Luteimonas sp.]